LSQDREIDYSTVQTYIRRLEAKGYLQTRRIGRTKIYSAKVRPRLVIREAIDDFLGAVFDGETMPLVRHLIANGDISDEEIDQMRQLLDKLEEDRK
jgi:predicted transcriptional regulator